MESKIPKPLNKFRGEKKMNMKEEFEKKFKVNYEDFLNRSGIKIEISRVHPAIAREFFQLADEDFCSDRGVCLKYLMDFMKGILTSPNEELSAKIDLLADEVAKLKQEKEKGDVVGMTASGKEIRKGGKRK